MPSQIVRFFLFITRSLSLPDFSFFLSLSQLWLGAFYLPDFRHNRQRELVFVQETRTVRRLSTEARYLSVFVCGGAVFGPRVYANKPKEKEKCSLLPPPLTCPSRLRLVLRVNRPPVPGRGHLGGKASFLSLNFMLGFVLMFCKRSTITTLMSASVSL